MIENDRQLGWPFREYRDTKANIEGLALGAADEGCVAYATDADEFGTYDGAAWVWITDHNQLNNLQGGQAGEYYHFTQAQHTSFTTVAGAGYALVSTGANVWAADQTPAWTDTHKFAAGITFNGASDANEITVPDNTAIALELLDAGGLEYLRINSADANPYFLIDPAGAGVNVGIGIAVPAYPLDILSATADRAINMLITRAAGANYGITAGASGAAVSNTGGYFYAANATNNYGVYIVSPVAAANNYALYSAALAQSYFAGNVGIGTVPTAQLEVQDNAHTYIRIDTDAVNQQAAIQLAQNSVLKWIIGNDHAVDGSHNFFIYDGTAIRMVILVGGNLGVKNAAPGPILDSAAVASLQVGDGSAHTYISIKGIANGEAQLSVENDARSYRFGLVGDDTWALYDDTANALRIVVSVAGAMQWPAYGAGALTTDGAGNITAVSDVRLKEQVRDTEIGLAEVLQMQGKAWHWTKESGLDTEFEYLGFIADDIEKIVPGAVGRMQDGMRTLNPNSLLPAFAKAIQELDVRLTILEG